MSVYGTPTECKVGQKHEEGGVTFGAITMTDGYVITIPVDTADITSTAQVRTACRDQQNFNGTHNPVIEPPTAVTAVQNGAVTDISWSSLYGSFSVFRNGTKIADVEGATTYTDTSETAEARDYHVLAISNAESTEAKSLASTVASMTYA